jgi:hypothetical protein
MTEIQSNKRRHPFLGNGKLITFLKLGSTDTFPMPYRGIGSGVMYLIRDKAI